MKTIKKIVASTLVMAMTIPVFTACNKSSGSGNTISADDPWYDVKTIELGGDLDTSVYETSYMNYQGMYNDGYVFNLSAQKFMPDDFDFETDNYLDYVDESLLVYDADGNEINNIPLTDYIGNLGLGGVVLFDSCEQTSDAFYIKVSSYDINTGDSETYRISVDLGTGEFGEPEEVEVSAALDAIINDGDASEESSHRIGEYTIRKFWMYGTDMYSYVLAIVGDDGSETILDLRDEFPNYSIYDIPTIIDIGNDRALVCGSLNGGGTKFFTIDFTSMNITEVQDDMSWISNEINQVSDVAGVGSVVIKEDGVYTIDFDTQTITPLMMFTDSYVNLYNVNTFVPIIITDDRCVFSGEPATPSYGTILEFYQTANLYVFTRAEENPNAGKTVIDAASVDRFSFALCNAVCDFNTTNEEYFIRLNTKYNVDNYLEINPDDDSANEGAADEATSTLSNQLAIDLMSGDGPDIIINAASLSMLNNGDYLMDLSEYFDTNIDASQYYMNIINASRKGDALYQIPLSFSILGISTAEDNVDAGQIGFTFDQYVDFVEGPCNGQNPFSGSKIDIFIELASCMQDSFITDDVVNFDTEEFRSLVEFVSENVNEQLVADDDYGFYEDESGIASIAYIYSVDDYFNQVGTDNVLLGFPSYDGRGPVIYNSDSVAVSSLTDCPDACLEFISVLLGEESQQVFAANSIPVNRAAFTYASGKIIESHNAELEYLLNQIPEAQLRMYGYNTNMMDQAAVDDFDAFIGTVESIYINDGSINSIIREEVPSYFEGQKTLEQIIPVLTDRVSTVLEERR